MLFGTIFETGKSRDGQFCSVKKVSKFDKISKFSTKWRLSYFLWAVSKLLNNNLDLVSDVQNHYGTDLLWHRRRIWLCWVIFSEPHWKALLNGVRFSKEMVKKQQKLEFFKNGLIKCNFSSGIMFYNVFCLYNHFSITKFTLNNLAIANVP